MISETEPILRIPIVDVPKTPEKILAEAVWEEFSFEKNPIAGALAHWGCGINNEELAFWLNGLGGGQLRGEDFTNTGFGKRFLYPSATTTREAAWIEEEIGEELILRACVARGIEPKDLSLLFVCNSFPGCMETYPNDRYGEMIASRAGVSKEAGIRNISLYCNSFTEAMRLVGEMGEGLRGKYVGIVAVEGLTKGFPRTGERTIDPTNASLFTNAGAGVVFKAGEDFSIIPGLFEVILDEGTIVGPCHFTFSADDKRDLMNTDGVLRQRLGGEAEVVFMDARKTIRWVLGEVLPAFQRSYEFLRPKVRSSNGILALVHQASRPVFDKLFESAGKRYGITDLKPIWVVDDGNSSGATFPTALLRAGTQGLLNTEGDIFCFGFGVGGNCSSFLLRFFGQDNKPIAF